MHLEKITDGIGSSSVQRGAKIGMMGNTGLGYSASDKLTNRHLHFEIREAHPGVQSIEEMVEPLGYMFKGPDGFYESGTMNTRAVDPLMYYPHDSRIVVLNSSPNASWQLNANGESNGEVGRIVNGVLYSVDDILRMPYFIKENYGITNDDVLKMIEGLSPEMREAHAVHINRINKEVEIEALYNSRGPSIEAVETEELPPGTVKIDPVNPINEATK